MTVSRGRYWLLAALAVAVGLGGSALVAEIVLRLLPVRSAMVTLPVNDANPVMRFQPNRPFTYSMNWNLRNVVRGRINNAGFVNDQDYDSTSSTSVLAVVGDSYVEALMVKYPETVQGRLAQRLGSSARVYSFGMSGAALAQYLAEAGFARAFRPQGLIVVIVGNDFDESLLQYRPARGYHYFVDDTTGLRLMRLDFAPRVLGRIARHSALARYLLYNVGISAAISRVRAMLQPAQDRPMLYVGNTAAAVDSVRVRESRRAVDAFLAQLPGHAGVPPSRILLVLDGIRRELYDTAALARVRGTYYDVMRRYVLDVAPRAGYEVLDLQPILIARHQRDGAVFEFPTDGHWNAIGHEEAAIAIAGTRFFQHVVQAAAAPR